MHDNRILIVRLSHLGDVIHALPLLSALRAEHPSARIAWAVQPEYSDLLRGRPELDSIITFDRRGGLSAWPRIQRDLENYGATWSIDAQGNVKSALVALASRAPRRTGFARSDWTEPFAAGTLTDEAAPASRTADGAAHAMQRMQALIRHVAPSAHSNTPPPWLPSVGATVGDTLFHSWFAAAPGPFVVLHLAQQGDVRAWSPRSFIALARDLASDHDVLVMSGPSESAEGAEAARALHGIARIRCIQQTGIGSFGAFLRAAATRNATFVGCDSGPMHLAWSSNLRVILLAGPQDETRTGPWPLTHSRHRIARAATSPTCAPCLARTCAHPQGPICMSRLDPTLVARHIRSA